MKKNLWIVLSLVGTLFLAITFLTLPTKAVNAGRPQLDRTAVFRTKLPHVNSHIGINGRPSAPGGGHGHGGGTVTCATNTFFCGGQYTTVGSTVDGTTTTPEAEEDIAINPNDDTALVAAISDFSLRGGSNTTKFSFSATSGTDWSESFVPLDSNNKPDTPDGSWEYNSDPVVAIDKDGNYYVQSLYFNGTNKANGIYVCVNTESGGLSFTASDCHRVHANLDTNATTDDDKDWMTVDSSGNVYAVWTLFTSNSDWINFTKSADHGSTWPSVVKVSIDAFDGAVQYPEVAVGPDGTVYVAYSVSYVGGMQRFYLSYSTDGGDTWTKTDGSGNPIPITPFFTSLKFNSTYRKFSYPSIVAGTSAGVVYMVYADQPSKSSSVEFVKVTLSGGVVSYTNPVAINDASAGQRLMPSIALDPAGSSGGDDLHMSWFDTRNSTKGTQFYDIYATLSADGGGTVAENQRVTTGGSLNAAHSGFIGDYGGEAALNGFAHPVWTSGGNGVMQTAKLSK